MKIYLKNYKEIFKKKSGLTKYDINNLNEVIKNILKNIPIKDIPNKRLMIPIYNLTKDEPEICDIKKISNTKLSNIITASSAAPYYFDPFVMNGFNYVDGGVFANNPSLIGYVTALEYTKDISSIKIMSLGNVAKNSKNKDTYFNIIELIQSFDALFTTKYDDILLNKIFLDNSNNYLRISEYSPEELPLDQMTTRLKDKVMNVNKTYIKIKKDIERFFNEF